MCEHRSLCLACGNLVPALEKFPYPNHKPNCLHAVKWRKVDACNHDKQYGAVIDSCPEIYLWTCSKCDSQGSDSEEEYVRAMGATKSNVSDYAKGREDERKAILDWLHFGARETFTCNAVKRLQAVEHLVKQEPLSLVAQEDQNFFRAIQDNLEWAETKRKEYTLKAAEALVAFVETTICKAQPDEFNRLLQNLQAAVAGPLQKRG